MNDMVYETSPSYPSPKGEGRSLESSIDADGLLNDNTIYDIIGIGIGPFNLGMAAMCEKLPLNCIFFDQNPEFEWHPGMMLPNARLQVPFYADLVTVVDPTSKYTFLNYLKEKKRLFKFAIHENNFVTRSEYNDYCKWVVSDLSNLRFNHKVLDVKYETTTSTYLVTILNQYSNTTIIYQSKNIVVGIGSVPYVPECVQSFVNTSFGKTLQQAKGDKPLVFHSSQYLYNKDLIKPGTKVTVIGSGQSAAEIFYDLLGASEQLNQLNWFTSSERFYPMEYSKLSLEMTSPDYIDHFYSLPYKKKQEVLERQNALYKGINYSLINEIYDALYLKDLSSDCSNIRIQANTALRGIQQQESSILLQLEQRELDYYFLCETDVLIMATGYQRANPAFLNGIIDTIQFDDSGMYAVNRDYSINEAITLFVQNAELHTHGFSAPDLGMGPYRNAQILNSILNYQHYETESKVTFQRFG